MSASNYLPLPVTVEEISSDWLTAALRQRTQGVTVKSHTVLEVINTTTTKVRIQLELDEAGKCAGIPERIIVKGGFQEHSRVLEKMHLREVRGYRDVFPVVPLHTPTCYFADFDATRRQGIVIMEDLNARGVSFCHATKPQTYEQAARRLSALARFHAQTWNSPELAPGGKWGDLVDFFDVMRGFFDRYMSPEKWEKFINMPRGVASSFRFRDRDWMVQSWARMCRFGQQLPQCVLHGDVHLGNLYIEADGTPGFLDTLASRGPGMLEVSYFVSASIDSADRPHWERKLIRHYLDELAKGGALAPDFDEAMRQYNVFLLYGLFIWQTTESHFQPETVNTANVARVSAAMLEHDTASLLASLN
jgi:hypothetical protein